MFFPSQPTTQLILFNSLLVVFLISLSWKARKQPYTIAKNERKVCWILLFICMLFPFYDIDFFNYIDLMEVLRSSGSDMTGIRGELLQFEWPYYYIGKFVNYNYFLFRLIVWGGAMVLYVLTMSRLKINHSTFILYFTIIALLLISYGRVTLAWAIAFYGYSFVVKPLESSKKVLSYIVGILLIGVSLVFHKTALLLPIAFIVSSIKLNKYIVVILLLSFPIFVRLADSQLLAEILTMSQDDTDILNISTAQHYLDSTSGRGMGVAAKIQEVLRFFVFYGCFIVCIQRVLYYKHDDPKPIKYFISVVFWLVYISSIFAFTKSANTSLVYYRFLNFAVFPMTIVLSYIAVTGQQKKQLFYLNIFAVLYTVYRLLYALYLSW